MFKTPSTDLARLVAGLKHNDIATAIGAAEGRRSETNVGPCRCAWPAGRSEHQRRRESFALRRNALDGRALVTAVTAGLEISVRVALGRKYFAGRVREVS